MRCNAPKQNLDILRSRELLAYDPETGVFTWLLARGGTARAGTRAGKLNNRGYITIMVDGENWLAHRLAWAHIHGELPELQLDHINRVRTDNRIANLRQVTFSENQLNSERSIRRREAA